MFNLNPIQIIPTLIAFAIAITLHEFAHAYVADRLGDPTARLSGRLTLNPLAHLDPIGTLCIILFGIGWGKPVPFDPYNLKNPLRDSGLISLAGPVTNFVLAILTSILLFLFSPIGLALNVAQSFIFLNLILGVFNLIPIAPLDGFKIVGGILSRAQALDWYKLESQGPFFLLALILPLFHGSSGISLLVVPVVKYIFNMLV